MHRIYQLLIISFVFLLGNSELFAQEDRELGFRAGLIGGFQATQIRGDDLGGYHKIGGSLGFISQIRLPLNISVQFEINYDQFGSKASGDEIAVSILNNSLKMDYIHVPVLARYHYKAFSVGGGLSYAGLVRYKEIDLNGADVSEINRSSIKSNNLLLALDASYAVWNELHFSVRYYYSLIQFRQSSSRSWFHNVLGFRLYYLF